MNPERGGYSSEQETEGFLDKIKKTARNVLIIAVLAGLSIIVVNKVLIPGLNKVIS